MKNKIKNARSLSKLNLVKILTSMAMFFLSGINIAIDFIIFHKK